MFLKTKSLLSKSLIVAASTLFFAACGGDSNKEAEEVTNAVTIDSTAVAEVPTTSYSLPSPLQIASIFKKSGLKFKDGLTNGEKDPSIYATNMSKSINLGVYSADLSYCVLNKQSQQAMNYIKLARTLADNLGMGSVFEEGNLLKRFEKNLGNEDSLAYIIAELQMVTDMYLDENDQQQITSLVFAGAWVESMYIGSKVFEKGKEQGLSNKLAEQMNILGSIVNALKVEEKKDAGITGLIADLNVIKDVYDGLGSVKAASAKTDNEDIPMLTNDELAQLSAKIEVLRNKFVKG
jgi:hypothetical protein